MIPLSLSQVENPQPPWMTYLAFVNLTIFLPTMAACLFLKTSFPEWIQARITRAGVGLWELVGLAKLVGHDGLAVTLIGPSGTVDFNGRNLEGLSGAGPLAVRARLQAVAVRDGSLIVRTEFRRS